MTREVDILLKHGAISGLALRLRDLLLNELPSVTEQPDETAGIVGYSYDSGYKGLICTIMPSKSGLKLGFYRGSELPDPAHLLTGSGKVHKYVEITSDADIGSQHLKNLLHAAVEAWHERAS